MPNLSAHIQTFSVLDAPYAGSDLQFDALDGYYINKAATAQLQFNIGAWYLITGPTLNDWITMMKRDLFPIYQYTWSKKRQLRFRLQSQIDNDATGYYLIGTGNVAGMSNAFGLKFTPTKIIGFSVSVAPGAEIDLITALTPGEQYEHLYEITFYPGNGVYFYVDGVLMGSITTHLPTGSTSADYIVDIEMLNDTNGIACVLAFSRIQMSQDR